MQLGITGRDKITGFAGVVTGITDYLSGCSQALLVPKIAGDGSFREGQWFDVQRIERVGEELVVLDNGDTPGPDKAPTRRS